MIKEPLSSKLGEVSQIFAGGDKPKEFSNTKNSKYQIPVFANGENNEGLQGYTVKAKVNKHSVTISARGTIGYAALREQPFVPIVRLLTLIPNDKFLDVKYLYYYLTLYRQAGLGSSQAQLTVPDIATRKIRLPELSDQKLIGKALYLLDEKIKINNILNTELEKFAETIYNYWFVQFDFPDKDGNPYKSSGGKMVWNKEIKRSMPEKWNVLELSDIITRSGTGLNPRNNFKLGTGNNYYITIKNIDDGKIIFDDKCDRVDDEALKIIQNRSDLQIGDILFTSIEPVGITYLIHSTPTNWNINESVFTLRPNHKMITPEYLLMLLSSKEMKAFTKNVSVGSIHKGIRHAILKTFKLTYSNKNLIDKFSRIIKPSLQRINRLDIENQKLVELRDWLLPMLMSGQIKVK